MPRKKRSLATTTCPLTPQETLIRLLMIARVLSSLGLLGCSAGDALFPHADPIPCSTSANCTSNTSFGTTADLWCVYTKYLEQENLPPACLRNPCPHIGQICSTGGVCEPPDQLDLRNNQDPQNPWGHCQKMVCRTAKDCLEPTPFCELGYCQSEHIIDLRP